MLDHVSGRLVRLAGDAAVVDIGGVGLRIQMPASDLASLDGRITVHTVLQIREDELHLYGFASERSRELFRALMTVNGVSARLALAVLSFHPPASVERAIAAGDADALTLVPGIGRKIALRIVLELRDKLVAAEPSLPAQGTLGEVGEALKGLGYSSAEVQRALGGLPPDGDPAALLRFALRSLGAREAVS